VTPIKPDLPFLSTVTAAGGFGLLIAFCVAQVGSLFSSVAWESITFTAGEVKDPKRNIPLSLFWGTALVIALYLLANVAYLCLLPLEQIQHAPDDRVATAAMNTVFSGAGAGIMAIAILVSTFGCNNGLILTGARVYYAMARDRLFFKPAGTLHPTRHTPTFGLLAQAAWAMALCLTGPYGQLLDYVIFAALIFYLLTTVALFRLRRLQPDLPRPVKAFGYPVVPALYILSIAFLLVVLLVDPDKRKFSAFGLLIVALGVPVYLLWRRADRT
jgi:APA family basic amino acid/polyamine antiporter